MTTSPQISVLMAVCNDERFLAEALDSLLAQTLPDFEIIAVNDASTDASRAILAHYAQADSRLRIVDQPVRRGLTVALNRAFAMATAPVIARMDSDDWSFPSRFERQWLFLRENPSVALVGCAFEKMDETGRCLGVQDALPKEDAAIRTFLRQGDNPFCHGGVMMRRELLESLGGYRAAFIATQDLDLWLRIPVHIQMANLPSVLYRHRRHSSAISRKRFLLQRQMKQMALALSAQRQADPAGLDSLMRCETLKAQAEWVTQFLQADLQAHRREYSRLLYRAGRQSFRCREHRQSLQWLQDSIALNPLQLKAYVAWLQSYLQNFT